MKIDTPNFIKQGDEYIMNMPAVILLVAGWLDGKESKESGEKANFFITHIFSIAATRGYKSQDKFINAFKSKFRAWQLSSVKNLCSFLEEQDVLDAMVKMNTSTGEKIQ